MTSLDVALGNDPRADATAAGGLDAAQQKQAFAAAAAIRLVVNGQATQDQAAKAVRDILQPGRKVAVGASVSLSPARRL